MNMHYGHFDEAGRLVSVFDEPDDSLGLVELADWQGWGSRPGPCHDYRAVGDGYAWVDRGDIDEARAIRWGQLKAIRDEVEFSTFQWDGSTFDADSESQRRIQGAVTLAQLALAAQQPYEVDWTLADNSVRTLAAADVIQVGQALALHVASAHELGRLARTLLDAALTVDQALGVQWPVPDPEPEPEPEPAPS